MKKNEITYKTKTANANEILTHLQKCSEYFFPPLSERVDIEEYSQKIFQKSITFEAWQEELLVGLVAAYFNGDPDYFVYITNVSVLKGFVGIGIASELLSNCINYAVESSSKKVKLEVYKNHNQAIGLYKKFNFTIDSVDRDWIKMNLKLSK